MLRTKLRAWDKPLLGVFLDLKDSILIENWKGIFDKAFNEIIGYGFNLFSFERPDFDF